MTLEGGISYIALDIHLHKTKICSSSMTTLLIPFSIILFTELYDQVVTTRKHQYVRISEHLVYTVIEFVKMKHSYIHDSLSMILWSQLQRTAISWVLTLISITAPVQTGPGAHPASYMMGTGIFPRGQGAHAQRWPSTAVQRRGYWKNKTVTLFSFWVFLACSMANFKFFISVSCVHL